ncbi:MAG TPA: helix-turn-helix domain-containing protein, partial [Syntrophorhabdales bacterium]|nr:helix-turn-helix domain-containing protein [Syntrophorhabdales bacterium]
TFIDLTAAPGEVPQEPAAGQELVGLTLEEMEALHIRRTLEMTRGRIEGKDGAAVLLGINPSTLRARMRKLRIPFGRKQTL